MAIEPAPRVVLREDPPSLLPPSSIEPDAPSLEVYLEVPRGPEPGGWWWEFGVSIALTASIIGLVATLFIF